MSEQTTGPARPLSFAVMAVPQRDGRGWAAAAGAWEQAGWDTIMVPDTLGTVSPFPALAAAAAATSRVHLRPWVLAAPLRTPAAVVREAQALQDLSDNRFELGLGSGRPDAAHEAATLGLPWPDAAGRRRAVEDVVRAVRDTVDPAPPVALAAAGERMVRTAAGLLTGPHDRLGIAASPTADADDLGRIGDLVRDAAPSGGVRLTYQLAGIGSRLPVWLERASGLDADTLRRAGAVGLLPQDPDEAAETLRDWPRRFGIDEVVVSVDLLDAFAPVLARLLAAGQASGGAVRDQSSASAESSP